MSEQQYAGFWIRVLATLLDTIWIMLIIAPILLAIYGKEYYLPQSQAGGFWDFTLNIIFPAVAAIAFWRYKSATPGKMILNMKIVDAATGQPPTLRQCIVRYLGYYLSILALMLGFVWVGIDKRKQGFHDKLAGTVVVKTE